MMTNEFQFALSDVQNSRIDAKTGTMRLDSQPDIIDEGSYYSRYSEPYFVTPSTDGTRGPYSDEEWI
jgi:hypothetical protein